ncbi:MAG: ABC transporter ATP-binding protein [Candidatus Bathyarchaeia archaeon]
MTDILEVRGLTKRFEGLVALSNVSLNVKEGEILGLIGPNGAGKTTLFNCITGFHSPDAGSVIFDGEDITNLVPHIIARKGIARTFQVVRAFHSMSVLDSVITGALCKARDVKEAKRIAMEVLEFTGLMKKKNIPAHSLTIVDRKRLGLASALATKPRLLLLDEVVAGLNPVEIDEIVGLLRRIREAGITLFVVEHVMRLIMSIADRIIVLHHGEKIAEGRPREIAENQKVIEAYLGERYA